jgi:hypothetical protein
LAGKADQTFNESVEFLHDLQWARDLSNDVVSAESVSGLFALAMEVNLHHSASYKRRVIDFLSRWPLLK